MRTLHEAGPQRRGRSLLFALASAHGLRSTAPAADAGQQRSSGLRILFAMDGAAVSSRHGNSRKRRELMNVDELPESAGPMNARRWTFVLALAIFVSVFLAFAP